MAALLDILQENNPNTSNEKVGGINVNEPAECETEESKLAREIMESEALARMLMAEEAQQSFNMQYEFMQSNTADMDTADLIAVQRLLRQDEESNTVPTNEEESGDEASEEESNEGGEEEEGSTVGPSYEDLLELGRHIGDVKQERWKFRSQGVIDSLPLSVFSETHECCGQDSMCIFCQDEYSTGDSIRKLPCKHSFHSDCVDEWLKLNDTCPMCKAQVEQPEDE